MVKRVGELRLREFRREYPMYDGMPDDELSDAIYRAYHADWPRFDFEAWFRGAVREVGTA